MHHQVSLTSDHSAAGHTRPHRLAPLDQGVACAARSPQNLVCMTLYNEPFAMFGASLASLVESLIADDARSGAAGHCCIAIIADGADRIDPAILSFFRRTGLLEAEAGVPALGETVHYSSHDSRRILALLGSPASSGSQISFAVCVKQQNQGKLHSHAVFFRGICERLQPRFCYQIDAGTIVDVNAVPRLVDYMNENPRIAAAASRVLTAPPEADASAWTAWQFVDFVALNALVWRTEFASGFLSTIPGQFCMFRWSAIGGPASGVDGRRPVDRYLRPIDGDCSPLERVLYLSEDRVIGNEIVTKGSKSWLIGYCGRAEATTDACDTFDELLRQRRRWLNAELAVRLSLWSRLPGYLCRKDVAFKDKARFSCAMLWQALLAACAAIGPAFLVLIAVTVFQNIASRSMPILSAAEVAVIAATAALIVLTSGDRLLRWRRGLGAARDLFAALYVAILVGIAVYTLPPAAAAVGVGALILTAAVFVSAVPEHRGKVLRYLPLYIMLGRVAGLVIYGYALANMHNVTWGTKGLTAETDSMRAEKRQMHRLRNILSGTIVAFNLACIAVGLAYAPDAMVELFSALLLALVAAAACVGIGWRIAPSLKRLFTAGGCRDAVRLPTPTR